MGFSADGASGGAVEGGEGEVGEVGKEANRSLFEIGVGDEMPSLSAVLSAGNSLGALNEAMRAAKPIFHVPKRIYEKEVDEQGRSRATGRRKDATAVVTVAPGSGRFIINGVPLAKYFGRMSHRTQATGALETTRMWTEWDVVVRAQGGGLTGQAGAVRLGLARALLKADPALRVMLKADGLLTRDSRIVERKKPGQAKARKKFQWVKR